MVLASENTGIEPSDPAGDRLLAAGGPTVEVRSRMTGVSSDVDFNQTHNNNNKKTIKEGRGKGERRGKTGEKIINKIKPTTKPRTRNH